MLFWYNPPVTGLYSVITTYLPVTSRPMALGLMLQMGRLLIRYQHEAYS